MKIKDLPPKLKRLAIERAKEDPGGSSHEEITVDGAFTWSKTPEGGTFWNNVNQGKIPPEYLDTLINNYKIF
jgi:hypothetical protein